MLWLIVLSRDSRVRLFQPHTITLQRHAQVRAEISPERLLVFDVAEGWGPLCGFLGVAVPDEPFPRINSTVHFWRLVRGGAL